MTPFLELDELRTAFLSQPQLVMRGTFAVLEKQKSLKRCKHLIEAWSTQRLETLENCIAKLIEEEDSNTTDSSNMESRVMEMFESLNIDALKFQELYYAERKHILFLDSQRCSTYNEASSSS